MANNSNGMQGISGMSGVSNPSAANLNQLSGTDGSAKSSPSATQTTAQFANYNPAQAAQNPLSSNGTQAAASQDSKFKLSGKDLVSIALSIPYLSNTIQGRGPAKTAMDASQTTRDAMDEEIQEGNQEDDAVWGDDTPQDYKPPNGNKGGMTPGK